MTSQFEKDFNGRYMGQAISKYNLSQDVARWAFLYALDRTLALAEKDYKYLMKRHLSKEARSVMYLQQAIERLKQEAQG